MPVLINLTLPSECTHSKLPVPHHHLPHKQPTGL
uniref:Uncharacterized protein n=1 Tax=Anguilla anguilla TaxID=7936 RepID=A0A0E9UEY4_ANGAN